MPRPHHPYYLTDSNGRLCFTQQGLETLRPYFALAGIDIRKIKTEVDYFQARQQSSPYFTDWLKQRAANWPDTDQFNLLRNALFDGV
ncbi:MAG: hypothetical protein CMK89_12930 [Pseudomonadales bacterium]|nr:hypothetical protein [Pseudomonadales bacterium]